MQEVVHILFCKKNLHFLQQNDRFWSLICMNRMSDEDIVKGCIKGNEVACKQLYDTFAPQMMGVCMRYAGSVAEAQEVMHDGMMKVFRKLNTLKDYSRLKSWVYATVLNTAITYASRQNHNVDFVEYVENIAVAQDYDVYEEEYLLKVIQSLPVRYRLVFNMHEIDGYSFEEIASELKLEPSSIRSILARARKMLQEKLKDHER